MSGQGLADERVDFLRLLGSCGHAGADGPDGLVSDHHVLHLLGLKAEEDFGNLCGNDIKMIALLALLELLAHAEDHLQAVLEGQCHLLDQLLGGLAVVFTTLGVAEDRIGATDALQHGCGHFAGEGTLRLVGAVLCRKRDGAALQGLCHRHEMGERRSNDELHAFRDFIHFCNDSFCKFHTFSNGGVHLPVAGYDFLSHFHLFKLYYLLQGLVRSGGCVFGAAKHEMPGHAGHDRVQI